MLWTGSPWRALSKEYGSPSTGWRRLRDWEDDGTLLNLWRSFLADLHDREKICWDEGFGDGTFVPAKKGAHRSAKHSLFVFLVQYEARGLSQAYLPHRPTRLAKARQHRTPCARAVSFSCASRDGHNPLRPTINFGVPFQRSQEYLRLWQRVPSLRLVLTKDDKYADGHPYQRRRESRAESPPSRKSSDVR